MTYCSENQIDLANLNIIGCDGTAVNTGSNCGVISRMENYLERPLQYIICLLHLNELPLRHLFYAVDGRTAGPNEFCGDIGKSLVDCHKLQNPCIILYFIHFNRFEQGSTLPFKHHKSNQ